MNIKKSLALFIAVLTLMTAFVACGKDKGLEKTTAATEAKTTMPTTSPYEQAAAGTFKFGTWDKYIFTNTWSNIRFLLPSEDYYVYTNKELEECAGDEDTVTNGQDPTLKANIDKYFLQDLFIEFPDGYSSLQIYYNSDAIDYTTKTYHVYLKHELLDEKGSLYDFEGYHDRTVGGQKYNMARYTDYYKGEEYYRDIYLRKIGNYMVIIDFYYLSDIEDEVSSFVKSFASTGSI